MPETPNKPTNLKNPTPPRQTDLMNEILRGAAVSINCVQIGIIRAFDPATQLANIEIAMKQVKVIQGDGTKILENYPLLMECPVFVLSGGGSFISLSVAPGDTCIVLFNDRNIDTWVNSGLVAEPGTSRLHDMSDAFALVGIKPASAPITNYLADGIRIFFGTNASIDMTDDGITMNGNVTVKGLLSTEYAGDTIVYNTHTHGGIEPGGSNTAPPNEE